MKELELFFTKSLIEMKEQEITFVWINIDNSLIDLIGFLVCLVHFCEIFIDLKLAPTQQHQSVLKWPRLKRDFPWSLLSWSALRWFAQILSRLRE